MIERQKRIEY